MLRQNMTAADSKKCDLLENTFETILDMYVKVCEDKCAYAEMANEYRDNAANHDESEWVRKSDVIDAVNKVLARKTAIREESMYGKTRMHYLQQIMGINSVIQMLTEIGIEFEE